jgi:hypothetical protein
MTLASSLSNASVLRSNIREINRINERELELAVSGGAGSWHDEYKGELNASWQDIQLFTDVFARQIPHTSSSAAFRCN